MASNAVAPAVSAARSSGDEILELALNTIRKSNRVVATKNAGEKKVRNVAIGGNG